MVFIYSQAIISFCHNPRVWQTDGRTDRQMSIVRPCVCIRSRTAKSENWANDLNYGRHAVLSTRRRLKCTLTMFLAARIVKRGICFVMSVRPTPLNGSRYRILFAPYDRANFYSFLSPNVVVLNLGVHLRRSALNRGTPLSTAKKWTILCDILETMQDRM